MRESTPPPLLTRKPLYFLGVVIALTLPAMLALFQSAGYWESHDGVFHLYRLMALENAWRQGQFYPRIFPEFAFGYGFTVLNFYGPLTYYVALVGRLVGLSPTLAMKATYALSYPLAAVGMWQLARTVWGKNGTPHEWAGVIAAAVYTYVPYHLADVQLRGALAESWAFVWWGWMLWAAWRGRFVLFMFTLAGLVLTHNLSVVLMAIPLAVWTLIVLAKAEDKRRYLLGMTLATVGAIALSAFYWLPVLLESRYVFISQDVGGLGFARHLQPLSQWVAATADYHYFPNQGVAGEHPLSWAQVVLLGVALVAGVGALRQHKALWLFGWTTLLLSIFLLSSFSYPLWEQLVFPFGLVQYPWRWLGITALASGLVIGGAVAFLPRRFEWGGIVVMGLGAGWLAWSGLAHLPYAERAVDLARYPVSMWEEDAANGQVGATWTAEFLPLGVTEQRWALARAPEQVEGVGNRTDASVLSLTGDRYHYDVEFTSRGNTLISVPRYAYPSMAASYAGDGIRKASLEPRGALGVGTVEIPGDIVPVEFDLYPLANNQPLAVLLGVLPLGVIAIVAWRGGRKGWISVGVGGMLLLLLAVLPQVTDSTPAAEYAEPANGITTIGEQAQLVGWYTGAVQRGSLLQINLMWFNLEQTDQNYVTYLHLTGLDGGAPLAQHDSQPNMGTVPTTRWLPGHLVEDLHLLEIPAELAAGRYQIWAGMYAVVEGQAVPMEGDSGERRLLGEIEVK